MQERSFFADSVKEALAEARQVMGEDSYLVEARRAARGAAGVFEVVVRAGDVSPEEPGVTREAGPAAGAGAVGSELARLSEEVGRLRQWIYEVRRDGPPPARWLEPWRARMLERGAPVDLAGRLMEAAREVENESAEDALARWQRCLHSYTAQAGEQLRAGRIAFLGPAGAGKTTLAMKTAIRMGLEQRRSIALIALEGWRAAGYQTLHALAGLIGAPFTLVDEPALLPAALREHAGKELVIVDTPGFAPSELAEARPWAEALAKADGIQRHLVLSAAVRSADLESAVKRWLAFRPQRLAFTRFDETSAPGAAPGVAAAAGLPVSFLSSGPRIPEDLELASAGRLLEMVVGNMNGGTARAAGAV